MLKLEKVGIQREEKLEKFARRDVVYSFEDETIKQVAEKIRRSGMRRIPVVSSNLKLKGIVTTTDLLDSFLRREDPRSEVRNIMVREVIFCEAEDSVGKALQKMKFSRRGGLPVTKKEKLYGIVTEKDFLDRLQLREFGIKVEEVMTKKPFCLTSSFSLFDVLKIIVNTKYRRLPVVEDSKLVGVVVGMDLLSHLLDTNFEFGALDEEMTKLVRKNVYSIDANLDLSSGIREMRDKKVGGLFVTQDSKLVGILTERDVLEILE